VVGDAGGDDQIVIGSLTVGQNDAAALGVEIDHFAEEHLGVRLTAKDDAEWGRDLTRRKAAGRHLVE
jgi:hypothetical protein